MTSSERERWEDRWTRLPPDRFRWYRSDIEPPLVALVESLEHPRGAALDLGCGAGVATRFLAGHFALAVGLDHALAAAARARSTPSDTTAYCVADVDALPFADGAISFVLDRGCSHLIHEEQVPTLLDEVARVLEPGGKYATVARVRRGVPPGPPVRRRLRQLRSMMGRRLRRQRTLNTRRLRARFPASLSIDHVSRLRQRSNAGFHQQHLYAVATRRADEEHQRHTPSPR